MGGIVITLVDEGSVFDGTGVVEGGVCVDGRVCPDGSDGKAVWKGKNLL